ncbi:DNA polymerase III subunit delta' [Sessilibacter corallicola]|uniref:DNA-directed DNA polymerase n=1 Tax=Sessilibacter corallicola TaxID=2904075 RepID=A0ABQ0A977_9GAMM
MSEISEQTRLKSPYPWQHQVWSRVEQSLQNQRLAHAIILAGPKGLGKQVFITAFGQRLLCSQPRDGMACGQCKSCQLNSAGTHPDLKWVLPEEAGKAIKIEQIRDLQSYLANTAQQGGRKVVVLGPVESLNVNAANALLKSLEEPSVGTHLLMFSHQLSSVLPTVRSRAQIVQAPMPSKEESLHWLSNLTDMDPQQLLELSNWSPLQALELCDADVFQEKSSVNKIIGSVYTGDLTIIAAVSKLHKLDMMSVLHCLLDHIDHNIRGMMSSKARSGQQSIQKLFDVRDKTLVLSQQLQKGANPNKQLALEELMLLYRRAAN